jgi:Rap guanine nucleotide exchange factor 1
MSSRAVTIVKPDLLHLRSVELAHQMTLLDMDMFQSIHTSEMLNCVSPKGGNAPNLKQFTEHFNKMSYWARTQILLQEDHKIREKYMLKFIRIMQFLRECNNFNSFLALLCALRSTDIIR